jgi:diaminopimelate decarboxylase
MLQNLSLNRIGKAYRAALSGGLLGEEDTVVIFHDLSFLEDRIALLKSVFPPSTLHGIAVKANPLARILQLLSRTGTGAEVASRGELIMAQEAGYDPRVIVFDSPVKTYSDLAFALEAGVHVNADSLQELERIGILRKKIRSDSTVGIRINPQVGVGAILESSVAGVYSKFGVPIGSRRQDLLGAFAKYEWLNGVHLHVGSQGCPMELLLNGIGVLHDFTEEIARIHGPGRIRFFDIGGGLPISYNRSATPPDMAEYAAAIGKRFPDLFGDGPEKTDDAAVPRLITEFGRWVHVNAGWVASRVEYVKKDPGINTAMIHAGADLFLRECLNPKDWQHEFSLLDKDGRVKEGTDSDPYHLAGPLCFSGDILAKNVVLPPVEEGDTLIIHDAGGYTLSMWSRYNSRQVPKVLGYRDDGNSFEVLLERESFGDLSAFWK